jgi:hypothetical protein
MNATLNIRFVNGFGNVQPGSDVRRRHRGLAHHHGPERHARARYSARTAPSKSSWSTAGKTLRLANYQTIGPITFSSWASSYGLSGRCGSDDR